MARKLRIQYPGAIYHVMNRGDHSMRQIRKRFSLAVASLKIGAAKTTYLLSLFVPYSVLTAAAQPADPNIAPFELPTPVSVIHSFSAATNFVPFLGYTNAEGAFCTAPLAEGSAGKIYGVAPSGGDFGSGTVFSLNTDGTDLAILHSFSALTWPPSVASNDDGSKPTGLIVGMDGKLYGTASQGGTGGFGAIFKLNRDGSSFTNLHSFAVSDGENPQGGVIQGPDGMLYGTAQNGGTNGSGTVFRVEPDGSGFTVLFNFTALVAAPIRTEYSLAAV